MRCKLFILSILTLTTLLLLLACFGISVYAWVSYRQLDNLNQSWLFIIMLVFAGVIGFYLIVTVIGGYGISQKRQGYVRMYSVLVFLCTLIFLAGAIAAIKIVPLLKGESCTDGNLFTNIQSTANASLYSLCYSCTCYIPSQTLTSVYSPLTLSSLSVYSPLISTTNSSLPIKTQDCPTWNTTKYSSYQTILQSLQTNLKCSGWCRNTNSLFFRFTDSGNGIPTNSCYESYQSLISKAGLIIEIFFFVLTGISVFKLLVSCLIDVMEQDGDSQVNYNTEAHGEHGEDRSNTNVIFAEKRIETIGFPYYQPKYNGYTHSSYNHH